MKFTITFNCDICGTPLGEQELSSKFYDPLTTTKETLGIADQRCESCESSHGNFSQMVEEVNKVLENGTEAEEFVKEHRKIGDVVSKLFKGDNLEKVLTVQFNNPLFKEKKEKLEK